MSRSGSVRRMLASACRMVQLQRAISAVGMFSLFEAMLQDGLDCSNGLREAETILKRAGETALQERFADFQLAINVLKHGRGRSYDVLIAKAAALAFRMKRPGEWCFQGDISEIATLEVDDAFVHACAAIIREVTEAVQKGLARGTPHAIAHYEI